MIAKAGKPVAGLVAMTEEPKRRQPGSTKGQIRIAKDFDTPLPEDVQRFFE